MQAIRAALLIAFVLAAINVVCFVLLDGYDFRLGPIHLVATYIFKPLLYLNAAFLLVIATRSREAAAPAENRSDALLTPAFLLLAVGITAAIYSASFAINLHFPDWTHQVTTSRSLVSLFTTRQYDGFYRPIAFTSLWLDNRLFGDRLWGYHLQSVLLQLLNGVLAARLAYRLGFEPTWARAAGLMFLALPAAFEAVIWPGARFDMLAIAFTLIALERALAGSVVASTAAYILGVLSKESAYCYPLVLAVLYLFRARLALNIGRKPLVAGIIATLALVAVRFAVYGNFGGYPGPQADQSVHFVFTTKTITSMFTRLPAALYLVNSEAELAWWMGLAVCVYVAVLGVAVFRGAALGARAVYILVAFAAAIPTLNMIGWLNHSAQQGRYVYLPGVWIVLAVVWALSRVRAGTVLTALLIASMGAAALFNTLAYVRMLGMVQSTAQSVASQCKEDSCCRTLVLQDVPHNLNGALYFRYELWHRLKELLPGVDVPEPNSAATPGSCVLTLRWTDSLKR